MIAGDWHGNGAWSQKAIWYGHKAGADAVVHVGDFGWWHDGWDTHKYLRFVQHTLVTTDMILYWVDGNHEDHAKINEWLEAVNNQPWSDKRYPRIIHLPRGFRWQWHGKTWMSVGGAHSVDRLQRTPDKSWWDAEHLTEEQIEFASRPGEVHVLVSHDCPYGVDIPGIHADEKLDAEKSFWPSSEIYLANQHRRKLKRIVDAVKPKVLYHGHYHVKYDGVYDFGGVRFPVRGLAEDGSSLDENTMILDLTAKV
jgi:predicted phosphodiesterase